MVLGRLAPEVLFLLPLSYSSFHPWHTSYPNRQLLFRRNFDVTTILQENNQVHMAKASQVLCYRNNLFHRIITHKYVFRTNYQCKILLTYNYL